MGDWDDDAREGELLDPEPLAWTCDCGSIVFVLREKNPICAGCGTVHPDVLISYPQETQDPCRTDLRL